MSTNGLTTVEANKLLNQYGSNELIEKTQSPILKFLSYLWGPIPWMIEPRLFFQQLFRITPI